MKSSFSTCLSIILLLLGWQLVAWQIGQPELVPSLPRLVVSVGDILRKPEIYHSVATTCLRALAGLALALPVALLSAYLTARFRWIQGILYPWLVIMRSVPVISFILLALIFLHNESIPLLIAFLTMYPLLTENLRQSILHLHPGYSRMGKQFHLSASNLRRHVYYPQIRPYLFSGLASAIGFGWRAIIMGEVLAQCHSGIGGEMKKAQLFINIPELMVWTFLAVALSWLSDLAIRKAARWQPGIRYARRQRAVASFTLSQPVRIVQAAYLFGVKSLDLTLESGKTYALSAPSGTGKTTCLKMIDGTYSPLKGEIRHRPEYISSVFQEQELLPHLSVLENAALPLASCYPKAEAVEQARSYLQLLELDSLAQRRPEELSYGQQQRVALARALAFPAPLLLMDEPFRGFDQALTQRIIRNIKTLQAERGQTIVFTSHQAEEISLMGGIRIPLD